MSRIQITANGRGCGPVIVDGHDIGQAVTRVTIDSTAGCLPEVELTMFVHEGVSVDGEARVLVPDGTREALIALGWTPPSEVAPCV